MIKSVKCFTLEIFIRTEKSWQKIQVGVFAREFHNF